MANYVTEYPAVVILDNYNIETLSVDDNRERTLITDVESDIETLSRIFAKEGFRQSSLEEKKTNQLCDGFRKKLSQEWDMHVRFLSLNQNKIAIDAEVETSTDYLQHITKPEYWVSVLFEVHNILSKHSISFKIWHKKSKSYVRDIVEKTTIELIEADGKIKWKPIAVGIALIIAVALIVKLLLRK